MGLLRFYRSPRLRGTLRVLVFLSFANLVCTALFLPQARAGAEEAAKQSGLQLLKQLGPSLVGPPELASINGQHMSLASKTTSLPVAEVLKRFEQHCRERSAGLAQELSALPGATAAIATLPEQLRDPSRWLSSRQETADGKSGQLACIARRDSGGGMQGLVDRVLAFTNTGDLAEIGDARYVVARRDEKSGQTHVLAMWTEGSFNIPAMFPDSGDAPGSDSPFVPRPPGARRVLSAQIAEHPYAIRMYDTKRSHAEVQAHYARELGARGFRLSPLAGGEPELDLNDHVQAFSKDGVAVIVVVHQTPAEQTGVSLIEMGSSGFAKASVVETAFDAAGDEE